MEKIWVLIFLAVVIFSVFSRIDEIYADQTVSQNLAHGYASLKKSTYGIIDEVLSWYFIGLNIDDLKIYGKPELVPGFVGNSLLLNGKDSYLVIKSPEASDTLNHVELSAWLKPNNTDPSREMTVIEKDRAFSLSLERNGLYYYA